jgi:hypothetical protein
MGEYYVKFCWEQTILQYMYSNWKFYFTDAEKVRYFLSLSERTVHGRRSFIHVSQHTVQYSIERV